MSHIQIQAQENAMISLIGISGSVRSGSYNLALLRAAALLMPPDSKLHIESIGNIPLYNGDEEAEKGVPDAVEHLKDQIAKADGLLLVTPEYNNSIPGVAKNAIDWLSRPPKDISRVFGGKAVAIAGASAWRVWNDFVAKCMASGISHAGRRAMDRGPLARLTRWQRHRCERRDFRPCNTRRTSANLWKALSATLEPERRDQLEDNLISIRSHAPDLYLSCG